MRWYLQRFIVLCWLSWYGVSPRIDSVGDEPHSTSAQGVDRERDSKSTEPPPNEKKIEHVCEFNNNIRKTQKLYSVAHIGLFCAKKPEQKYLLWVYFQDVLNRNFNSLRYLLLWLFCAMSLSNESAFGTMGHWQSLVMCYGIWCGTNSEQDINCITCVFMSTCTCTCIHVVVCQCAFGPGYLCRIGFYALGKCVHIGLFCAKNQNKNISSECTFKTFWIEILIHYNICFYGHSALWAMATNLLFALWAIDRVWLCAMAYSVEPTPNKI